MAHLISYFYLIRPVNLVLIVLSQYFIQFHVIYTVVGDQILLKPMDWLSFTATTVIIAASGYIINDIFDSKIDKINKPEKSYIPEKVSLKKAWLFYGSLVLLGFLLSLWVAWNVNFISHLWIYPTAVGLLYVYAKKLKSTILWGNVIVSLFVAMVWGILFYIEGTQRKGIDNFIVLGYGFSCVGFFTNLMREIVKDIEDIEGDRLLGIITLPITCGLVTTKNIIYGLGFFLVLLLMYSIFLLGYEFEYFMYIVLMCCFMLSILIKVKVANKKYNYSYISRQLKIFMALGLLGILLASKTLLSNSSHYN